MNSCNDGSNAPSYMRDYVVDVSPVPLGMNAAHDSIVVKKKLWARWKSLEEATIVRLGSILKHHKVTKITL